MFKDFRTWLIIGLVLLVVYLILSRPSVPDPAEITTLKQRDKEKQEQIDSVRRLNKSLLDQFQKEVLRREQDSASFVARLNAKLARQVKIKTVVLQTVDTLPVVKEYLIRQDSITEDLSNRVRSLEFELASTTKTLLSIRSNFETEISFMQDKYKIALQEGEVYRKGWRKERRKTKLFKVLAVAGSVGGIILGNAL